MKKNIINTVAVKKVLPYGSGKEIAKRSNVTIFTVSNVLNGRSKNPIVLKEIENYLMEIKAVPNRINALVMETL